MVIHVTYTRSILSTTRYLLIKNFHLHSVWVLLEVLSLELGSLIYIIYHCMGISYMHGFYMWNLFLTSFTKPSFQSRSLGRLWGTYTYAIKLMNHKDFLLYHPTTSTYPLNNVGEGVKMFNMSQSFHWWNIYLGVLQPI
mgnify:CR=1 FL=1